MNLRGVDHRCVLWDIKNEAVIRSNKSALKNKGVYKCILVQIRHLKEGAFGRTYFRDIYSSVYGKWYRKSWKEFDQLKNIDQECYCSSYYDVSVNKYGVKCETLLRFWENKGWINKIDPYGLF